MRGNWVGNFVGDLAGLPQDEQLHLTDSAALGTRRWLHEMNRKDKEFFAAQFHKNLGRWRQQMDSLARETGELPRGYLRPHGYDWEEDKRDSLYAAEQCEQRGLEFVFTMEGGAELGESAAANGGFTAINNLKGEGF